MDKRKSGYIALGIIVVIISSGLKDAEAEDLKQPLLQLPKVEIVGKRGPEQPFMENEVRPEEFSLQKETGGKNRPEESSGYINIAHGRFNSSIYDIVQSTRTEHFYYSAQLSVDEAGGERPNSQITTYRPSLKLGIPFDKAHELDFKLYYFNKIMGLPGKMDVLTPDAKRRNSDVQVSTAFTHGINNGKITVEPYYENSILNEDISRKDFKNKVTGMKMSVEADENTLNFDIYQNQLIDYYEQVMLEAQLRLAPWQFLDKWQLIPGINIFAQERFGQRPAPFLELIFKNNEKCLHKLKLTREFEPLIFNQMYLDANYVEVNSSQLRPRRESIVSYQFDRYFTANWRTSIIVYMRQDKDMWFWDDGDNNGLYSPTLIDKVNFGGIKLSTEYNWNEWVSHFLSLTVQKARNKDSNYEFVPYEPKQRLSAGLTYKIDKKIKMDIVGDYFGRRYYQGNSKESLRGYLLLGSKVTYSFKDYLTLFVLVDNLLNDHYEIVKGYPNQSSSALAGITVKF